MAEENGEVGSARLCHLLGNAFRPRVDVLYALGRPDKYSSLTSEEEAAGVPMVLTLDMEKDVLISLTLVYREVNRWTFIDSNCKEDVSLEPIHHKDCSWHMRPPIGCESCLRNAVSLLIVFLGGRSQHVRHMATKVLVIISSFLQKYERKWEEFSHLLWTHVGVMIQKKSLWHIPVALMEALQTIHKSLKNDHSDLTEANLHFALQSLLNFPREFLHDISDTKDKALIPSDTIDGLFLGATLRLLCTLVEKTSMEAGSSMLDDASVYIKVTTLVYDLLVYCFSIYCRFNVSLSQYIRHKSLALMIRLSVWNHWHRYALGSCIQLLQKYFKDIMMKPITTTVDSRIISLEGSPFLSSFSPQAISEDVYTAHLHRQTIFLFIKCCYSSFRRNSGFGGLSELSTWLLCHVTFKSNSEGHAYLSSCSTFSLSFLQLFIDEDDLLFEMLLQLLDTPSPVSEDLNKLAGDDSEQRRRDICRIWNIFNPIRLLHAFLHLIHYDHSVLLDYLMSKDSGIPFVQYLLRCLRLVCESWQAFTEFSMAASLDDHDAKQCLLSLKSSMESLHHKGLFPYNPTALLRRFTRFQQLCEG